MATERNSNIELFRIFLMVMLIMPCHYVMSGGIINQITVDNLSFNSFFAELFAKTGYVGNNCFVLITGYFMCDKNFSWLKVAKLFCQVEFYFLLFFIIFCVTGYSSFSFRAFYNVLFYIPRNVGVGFIGTFLVLYLLIPYINKLIAVLENKELSKLALLLIAFFCVFNTMFFSHVFEMVGWYVTVYIIGACLKKCLPPWCLKRKSIYIFLFINISIVFGSIVIALYLAQYYTFLFDHIQIFIRESNYLMSLSLAVSLFLFFQQLELKTSHTINTLATTILGVLCIHDNSGEMQQLIYKDIFNVTKYFYEAYFPLLMFMEIAVIFMCCAFIDILRRKYLEIPLFKWIENHNVVQKFK